MGKIILGGIVGAIIVLIWGFISWSVLPWHSAVYEKFQDEQAVSTVIRENVTQDGIYVIPSMEEKRTEFSIEGMKEAVKEALEEDESFQKTPFIYAQIKLEGRDPSSWKTVLFCFFTQFVGAALISYLLMQAKELHYCRRVFFVTLIGAIVGILAFVPNWNWIGASLSFTFVMIADMVISWFLAGIFLAAFIRSPAQPELMM